MNENEIKSTSFVVDENKRKEIIKQIETLEPIQTTDSTEVIKQKLQKQSDAIRGLMTFDSFANSMARLGFGQPNVAEGAEYPNTRMTRAYQLWNSIYRSSWVARKIIDVYPADMLKNWIKIVSGLDPDQITKLNKIIRRTKTKEKLKLGLQWGRLYGGAAALILIDGDDDKLDEPLDYDNIMPGTYKGLMILDRWSGIYPSIELISDINDPDFGLPEYYTVNIANTEINALNNSTSIDKDGIGSGIKVHNSRIIRFPGRELPYWEKIQEIYWGESELEIVYEELKKRDNTSYNIASMIFLANIRVLQMNDLGQLLGAGSEQAKKNLYNVIEAQNELMNNMGIYVMDKDDEFTIHNYTFSGLDEIYQSFMLDVAGASEMPVTKLFGREPSGFNSTGESDLKQYYDSVAEKQETYLLPAIDKLLPIVCMSTFGAIPDDLDWKFNPVYQITNKDMAELAQSYSTPVFEALGAGIITKSIALKELRQQSEITGFWTSITDEYIDEVEKNEKADNQVYSEEEEKLLSDELDKEDSDDDINNDQDSNDSSEEPRMTQKIISKDSQAKPKTWRERFVERLMAGIIVNE